MNDNLVSTTFAIVVTAGLLGVASCGEGSSDTGSGGSATQSTSQGSGGDAGSTGTGGSSGGVGIAANYPGDVGLGSNPSVLFFEDFEDADVATMAAGWDTASDPTSFSLMTDVPAGAVQGSQSLRMLAGGADGITLYKSLPPQQDTVYVRYYAMYDDPTNYHHTGMWLGGFNPPTPWPQGTAGLRPDGTDFFQNAFEPQNGALGLDHYAQWPGMDCFMEPGGCWGNNFLDGAEPTVSTGSWTCIELMIKLNTPGQSDGEYAVYMGDNLVQHLRPGSPTLNRLGNGVWQPDPNGTPFPGFDWRNTPDLGFNWIWLDFYVDAGPSTMGWDQVVVATERIGCMAAAK